MKQTEKVKYSPALIENLSVQAQDLKASTKLLRYLVAASVFSTVLSAILIIITSDTDKLPSWRIAIIVSLIVSLCSLLYSLPAYFVKNHMLQEIIKTKKALNH